jgi:hypothetical protein
LSRITRLYDARQTAENTETKMMRFIPALLRLSGRRIEAMFVPKVLQPGHSHG